MTDLQIYIAEEICELLTLAIKDVELGSDVGDERFGHASGISARVIGWRCDVDAAIVIERGVEDFDSRLLAPTR
jgi:hypothetical protein